MTAGASDKLFMGPPQNLQQLADQRDHGNERE